MTAERYIQRISKALQYIDANFRATINIAELAGVACFSQFHFHRIFTAYTGESLWSYIKRLRIQYAAEQLLYGKESITQIALSSGFESQTSFNKAFKQITGMSPSNFRRNGQHSIFECIRNHKQTYGDLIMNPEIVNLKAQHVMYLNKHGDYNTTAPAAWSELISFATENNLLTEKVRYFGIAYDNPKVTATDKLRYDACITVPKAIPIKKPFGYKDLVEGRYAVFKHIGEYEKLDSTYSAIFSEWYPKCGYELRDVPSFIEYLDVHLRKENPSTQVSLIHIPIV